MDSRRVAGIALVVGGTALAGVSAIAALTFGSGDGPSIAASTPVASASLAAVVTPRATPSPEPAPTAAPSASPSAASGLVQDDEARIRAFYEVLVPAVREPDAQRLVDLVHPATTDRYGVAACLVYFAGLDDPDFDVAVDSVDDPAPWDYVTDDLTTTIEDAWAVDADLTSRGSTVARELHVAEADGDIRWFTDCGVPLPS
jgi:hypothetical protein